MIVASVLTPIEQPLTWLLEELHTALSLPWAWAVVGLTLIVRVLLVPLTVRQIHSMQRMQQYLPQMKEIQKKHKDKQKRNEELMRFYREHNINPAASCLPMLFQIPIFFALYFVLRDFDEEIRPKYPESDLDWLSFVPDITANIGDHWSGYLLIVVYVVSQIASTYFMSQTMDRTQRIIFMFLPVVFVFFIIDPPGGTVFPVGLLIYWVTTNLWTVGQGVVTRRLIPRTTPAAPPKRSSRAPARPEADADGARSQPPAPTPAPTAVAAPRLVKR